MPQRRRRAQKPKLPGMLGDKNEANSKNEKVIKSKTEVWKDRDQYFLLIRNKHKQPTLILESFWCK